MADTTRVQAAIDAGATLAPGTYVCAGLTYPSGCRLIWPGVTLVAAASLPTDVSLLWNRHFNADADCLISGIVFDGSNLQRTQPLVYAIGVKGFTFTNCTVRNTGYIGLGIANGDRNRVMRCYFSNTGNPIETTEGGAAIWVGATGGHNTTNVEILDNLCEDTQWSFLYLSGSSEHEQVIAPIVGGNVTRRTKESAIFTDHFCKAPVIRNNSITTARRKHIMASGIECGSSGSVIDGNILSDCGGGNVDLMDCSDVTVINNLCRNPGREEYFSTAGCIQMVTLPGSLPARNVRINDNWVVSNTPVRGIAFDRQAGGAQVFDAVVTGNNAAGSSWSQALYVANGMLVNPMISGNVGF